MKATSGGLRGRGSRRGRRDCWATTAQATPSPASDLRPPTPGAAHPARGGPYAAGRGFRGTLFPPHRRPPGPPCPRHLPAAPARSPGPGCGPAAPVRRKPALAQEAFAPLALRPSVETMPKLQGFEFWSRTLGGARHVVAPMVDQSELAWRLLSRRHGAQLCYTPMLHAQVFVRDANYRKENLYCEVCPEDRPLIVQFCANDPEVFVQAALLAQDYCDAIDLNLGCPQMIAKRGHYGAFLQEEWGLLQRMILLAHEKLSVPITCKIRVFPEIDKTVRYAQMLEQAGCQLLTVHGRTKEQKGPTSGAASWEHIKAVRQAVAIPVFANGNIQCLRDVERCIQDTGVQGVMSAEGNLHNPALFEGRSPAVWELAEEYLDIVRQHPCPLSYVRAHLFKLWHHTLQVHQHLREELAKVKTLEAVAAVSQELKLRCQEDMSRQEGKKPSDGLPFFHWVCQPYSRPGPREGTQDSGATRSKRALEDEGSTDALSKNKQRKQLRNPRKTFDPMLKPKYAKCDQCGNPKGNRCVFNLCRGCCKKRAFKETADCPGHGLLFKTKLEKSLAWKGTQPRLQEPQPASPGEPGGFPEILGSALA